MTTKEDEREQYRLSTDWDYFLNYYDVSEDMTIKELKQVLLKANSFGWDVDANELLEML